MVLFNIKYHFGNLFNLQNDTMKGCILTCEHDGCNLALPLASNFLTGELSLDIDLVGG